MKTIDQIRNQVSVMPCRFAERATPAIQPIPVSVQTGAGGSTDAISLLYGFPTKAAENPFDNGLWILRGDLNSAGCLASDELFFRLCGGYHTFSNGAIAGAGGGTYVSSITVDSATDEREFVRNPSYDVSGGGSTYYAWTCEGDIVYTNTVSESAIVSSQLLSVESSPEFPVAKDGDEHNILVGGGSSSTAIVIGDVSYARDSSADYIVSPSLTYYGWDGGMYTTSSSPVQGDSVYTRSDTGVTATAIANLWIVSATVSSAGDGYPKDAVLDHDFGIFSVMVMSKVEDNRADFTKDGTELQTERNWRIVEPDKAYDISAIVCQVDWSQQKGEGLVSAGDRWFSCTKKSEGKPSGLFAKTDGIALGTGGAGVFISVKDTEEGRGY